MNRRVKVWLTGARGKDKFMLLDEADWEWIVRDYGDRWTCTRPNYAGMNSFVVSRRGQARTAAGPIANNSNVYLSRVLAKPKRNEHVFFRDGNSLNLTRDNLTCRKPEWRSRLEPVRVEYVAADEVAADGSH